ncbi:hypothetical protein [Salinilacihabitans rarus]|uniref:hypothetical protein n=1 Tax=Salinilacihabitans rarus TaxID=2961596 RepID=UPI0020C9081F|nr:hypothetical protein [Salinilacihabitans rarus]
MKNSTPKPDEGIGLKLLDEIAQMDILLLSDDSEPLYRELLGANAKTKPEEVEHPCEKITGEYRDGGGNERPDPPAAHGWRRIRLSRRAEERTRYSLTLKCDKVSKPGYHD